MSKKEAPLGASFRVWVRSGSDSVATATGSPGIILATPGGPFMFTPGSPFFIGNRTIYSVAADATSVAEAPTEMLGAQLRETIVKTVNGYGWDLWFEDEPDGSVTGYLIDSETKEIVKTGVGADFTDVYLALGIDTLPPSEELREHREQTAS